MSKDLTSGETAVGCAALISLPFLALWRAYAFRVLWGWFVLPQLGIATPSTAVAVGIMALISMLRPSLPSYGKEDTVERGLAELVYCWTLPAWCLLTGYCARAWL